MNLMKPMPDTSIPTLESPYEGCYLITWEGGVRVLIDDLYEHRNLSLEADITITDASEPLYPFLLGPVRTYIDKTWAAIVKDLESISEKDDWRQRLTWVTRLVKEHYKKGNPIESLSMIDTPPTVGEILSGIVWEHSPTLIYGGGGIGKSFLALLTGTSIHNGVFFAGHKAFQQNCLYLDWETDISQTYYRGTSILEGLEINNEKWPDPSAPDSNRGRQVFYRFMNRALMHDVRQLRRQVAESNIGFVVIDSAGPACGGEPESSSATMKFFEALRAISPNPNSPLPTLILAHVSHDKLGRTGGHSSPFGSVFWNNMPRNTFELDSLKIEGSRHIDFAVHHRKTNSGPDLPSVGYRLHFGRGESNPVRIEQLEKLEGKLSKGEKYHIQAQKLIKNMGPMSIDKLAQLIDPATKAFLANQLIHTLDVNGSKMFETFEDENDGKEKWRLTKTINESEDDDGDFQLPF